MEKGRQGTLGEVMPESGHTYLPLFGLTFTQGYLITVPPMEVQLRVATDQ